MSQENDRRELLAYLRRNLAPEDVQELKRIGRGQSNPTYLVRCKGRRLALRIKPSGELLRSAHQVEREYRVMSALSATSVPVPEMVALVTDKDSPLGRAFFLMEFVDGEVHFDPALPAADRAARRSIFDRMNRVLADIHRLKPESLGLADLGRPGNYFVRQADRWRRQYYDARTLPNRDMDALIRWISENMVEDDRQACLVHGDYRLDNLIFCRSSNRVLAVIDWELATIGHPMADLAYQCMQWRMPHGGALRGLGGIERSRAGIPSERDYVEDYCRRRRIPVPENWTFFLAFAFFRLAAILEGVGRRALNGNAANPQLAAEYGKQVPFLARAALAAVQGRE